MGNPAARWILERRKRQSEAIKRWKPWEQATGPRSLEGKERVSKNAWMGGHRAQLRELSKLVNTQIRASRELLVTC